MSYDLYFHVQSIVKKIVISCFDMFTTSVVSSFFQLFLLEGYGIR